MSISLRCLLPASVAVRGSRSLSSSRMALHQASDSAGKLVFAPTGSLQAPGVPGQAGQFTKGELRRSDLDPSNPITQFHAWFREASQPESGVSHPETCTLSTAQLPSGRVSARVVYMKELDKQGFVIYSNFGTSGKARDLFGTADGSSTGNPWASLVFWWEPLERQVRVEGKASRIPAAESQEYFKTRARGSKIGAWSSMQSAVLRPEEGVEGDDGRAMLEDWVKETETNFKGVEDIPVPEFWGGLRIVPERFEFWQGRQSRLHDRFVYERVRGEGGDKWTLERLSP